MYNVWTSKFLHGKIDKGGPIEGFARTIRYHTVCDVRGSFSGVLDWNPMIPGDASLSDGCTPNRSGNPGLVVERVSPKIDPFTVSEKFLPQNDALKRAIGILVN